MNHVTPRIAGLRCRRFYYAGLLECSGIGLLGCGMIVVGKLNIFCKVGVDGALKLGIIGVRSVGTLSCDGIKRLNI